MSMIKKSITVTDRQEEWIKARIASGDYGNESEVIRDLIRREQTRSREIEAIRAALIEGEQSGMSDRSPKDIMAAAKQRLKTDGKL